ncbi:MAG: phosphotransferase [Propionibacteriaceae bacterium]|nr:phosphotransferase [Propionibacteriaceae bacterium]
MADGTSLLTTAAAAQLLTAVVGPSASIKSWCLDHVDADPGRAVTATYRVDVASDGRVSRQTIGCTVRTAGLTAADRRAEVVQSGSQQVACWVYPDDPDLPGLRRASDPVALAALLRQVDVAPRLRAANLRLDLIGYRPRRRAVFRARLADRDQTVYLKVLRPSHFEAVVRRHRLLEAAGTPSPRVLATTDDHLLVIAETPGTPLARAVFEPTPPVAGQQLIALLDAMPPTVAQLGRRPPWASAVAHYAGIVQTALPELRPVLDRLGGQIERGLAGRPPGNEPTHGDFYEAQVFVRAGAVSGLIDIDTIGPGRRVDDLACLVAHLHCIQRMNQSQSRHIRRLLAAWMPAFDRRVDPVELRLRAAAVVISLATGPYRGQEPDWRRETTRMITQAETLVDWAQSLSPRL